MKTCSRCGVSHDERDYWCKPCRSAYAAERYRTDSTHRARIRRHAAEQRDRARSWKREYLASHPCVDCGETNVHLLEFDHRDPRTKEFAVSDMMSRGYGLSRLWQEAAKCDIRCKPCHRKRHEADEKRVAAPGPTAKPTPFLDLFGDAA